jgi:thiol-disulfide isomerase/thioredoxin
MRSKLWLSPILAGVMAAADGASAESDFERLRHATGWLNSPPLTEQGLRGKVVLVDFWTYTCINWLRTLPYLRAWAEKYGDQGLVVIGVHTPEFEFEKDAENVRRAVRALGIEYPVATDDEYAVWREFRNNAWPALYFIDVQGRVRYRHVGEGAYDRIEKTIQELLAEAGHEAASTSLVSVDSHGVEAAADWTSLRSPETYLGYERTTNLASRGIAPRNARRTYEAPKRIDLNRWALAGDWTMQRQAVVLHEANGRIAYRFHARDLHLVMGPGTKGRAVRFRVLIDGEPPGSARGEDIDEQGYGTVSEQRLYQLIRQRAPIDDRHFEIEFLDAGVEAYAFTFG